jgi:NADPH-dependent 2,4-dienoyl-CoA reductase/sulfur reductase-like enzyme
VFENDAPEHIETDVAIVGAGPAGIAAAVAAASAGRRVVLLDEAPRPGGNIWRHTHRSHLPGSARQWLARLDGSGARVINGATVVDATRELSVTAERAGQPLLIQANSLILTTGARERFLPFPGWTLPGVFGVGGGQALLKSGLNVKDKTVVVAGSGPLLLPVAAALAQAGAHVALVAEQAPASRVTPFAAGLWRSPSRLAQAAGYRARFRRYALGTWVVNATGQDRVKSVTVANGKRAWSMRCDLLCVGYGLVPANELAIHLGADIDNDLVRVDGMQRTSVAGVFAAGEPTGIAGMDAALVSGQAAGFAAAGDDRRARALSAEFVPHRRFAEKLENTFALRPELRGLCGRDTVVCRCEDVRFSDFRAHRSARQSKLYERAGMGPCQGRVCGPAVRFLFGWGPDTVRPPLFPARIATLSAHRTSQHHGHD